MNEGTNIPSIVILYVPVQGRALAIALVSAVESPRSMLSLTNVSRTRTEPVTRCVLEHQIQINFSSLLLLHALNIISYVI